MRRFKLDDKVVKCPNSSTMGFSDWKCKRGDLIVFKENYQDGSFSLRLGRSLGRVSQIENDGLEDCVGHVCAIVPTESFAYAIIRWIDPKDITEVRKCPKRIPSAFFEDWDLGTSNAFAEDVAMAVDKGYWSEPSETLKRYTLGVKGIRDIEDKIAEAEEEVVGPYTSGTIIQRVLAEKEGGGVRWSVGLGILSMEKIFGYGSTISTALENALKRFREERGRV